MKERSKYLLPGMLALSLVLILLSGSCSVPESGPSQDEPQKDGLPAMMDPKAVVSQLSSLDSKAWVSIYNPEKSWNGYNLDLYMKRIPILLDMNGRIVHAWPQARVQSRVRLLEDGSLLGIGLDGGVMEYDWKGNLVRRFHIDGVFTHHDVIRLANGNTLLLVRSPDKRTDDLIEVAPDGAVIWEWQSADHLIQYFARGRPKDTRQDVHERRRKDVTHINSVQELPPNPMYSRGDTRFQPGHLLISARDLDRVFIIDKVTGEVVWHFGEKLDRQHEALMIGPGIPGHGNILIFNNGYESFFKVRGSSIMEVDPSEKSIVWQYQADGFYTQTHGVEQPLPNGNILITSTRGGRAFEITRDGKIVWEWTPPYEPRRLQRYSYDHCPQLASLKPAREESVEPPSSYMWVDTRAYAFTSLNSQVEKAFGDEKINVLKKNNDCNLLFLPAETKVHLTYGLDIDRAKDLGFDQYTVRFSLRSRLPTSRPIPQGPSVESQEDATLFEDTVDLKGKFQRRRTLELDQYSHQWVELCVETEEIGSSRANTDTTTEEGATEVMATEVMATEVMAYWFVPRIRSGALSQGPQAKDNNLLDDLTKEEIESRKKHIKALGYVD